MGTDLCKKRERENMEKWIIEGKKSSPVRLFLPRSALRKLTPLILLYLTPFSNKGELGFHKLQ